MQELWQRQLDSDEPLPDDVRTCWHSIMMNLKQKVISYHVARCHNKPDALSKEIHIFIDASNLRKLMKL